MLIASLLALIFFVSLKTQSNICFDISCAIFWLHHLASFLLHVSSIGNMPLVDELVFAKKSDPPVYTHDKKQKCDWSIIFKKPIVYDFASPNDRQLSPIEQFKYLQQETSGKSQSILDETQMLGIENFLENRVSLIQVTFDVSFYLMCGKEMARENIQPLVYKKGLIVDGHCDCEFYTFIRPNQEQLRKTQLYALWQESNLRPCDSGAALGQLSYRSQLPIVTGWVYDRFNVML